ncbi:fluoride efflux transporter CrcB [soil metagenome]
MPSPWAKVLALAIGGAIGANARYWLGFWVASWAGTRFPWSTLLINVSGAFALGVFATIIERYQPPSRTLLTEFLLVGILGGYTTFSTFTLESLRLWHNGALIRSLGYMAGSVTIGFAAVALGVALTHAFIDRSLS